VADACTDARSWPTDAASIGVSLRASATPRAAVRSLHVRVLVIGSGGREHALALGLARDPDVTAVHAAPGNPGIAAVAQLHPVDQTDPRAVAALATSLGVDLVVVGPEAPLVAGVADAVRDAGVAVFGPSGAAARIEGSKAFAKDVMAAAEVPTALAHVCTTRAEAEAALDAFGPPYVVKDDGLAAGKGVVVTEDRDAALAHAAACGRVVVEEFLDGPEVSLFAVTDGSTVYPLQPAQDYKRAYDGDLGPNTGGMGAYSPLPWAPDGLDAEVRDRVLAPTVRELARRGTPFVGLLYAGLALTRRGVRVVEFNARFGDPETQALLPRLATPLGRLLLAAAQGRLDEVPPPRWQSGAAVAVVVAADGYPDSPRKGDEITGVAEAEALDGVDVVHAGTALDGDRLVTAGGRVLAVTAVGDSVEDARKRAYAGVSRIHIDGAHHRSDIAEGV
jgi:phosphoribosylamine--glycine ligase